MFSQPHYQISQSTEGSKSPHGFVYVLVPGTVFLTTPDPTMCSYSLPTKASTQLNQTAHWPRAPLLLGPRPSFCFLILGITPMSTRAAEMSTAQSLISRVVLLKSVCVAAATVARRKTKTTYPLILCHL